MDYNSAHANLCPPYSDIFLRLLGGGGVIIMGFYRITNFSLLNTFYFVQSDKNFVRTN